jgi:hypothetical protein
MKNIILIISIVAGLSLGAYAQEKAQPTEKDKTETIPANAFLKRGAPLGHSKKVSLARVLAAPEKYAGRTVRIEGVVVRSCRMEGCWAEIAPKKDASRSVRVKMKDHAFFIPLRSAGSFARAEGTFTVRTLSKAEVDHMIEDDGAKFPDRNADGSVTEISFEAIGIELTRKT